MAFPVRFASMTDQLITLARAAGLTIELHGVIGNQRYTSVTGTLEALERFGDAYSTVPDAAALRARVLARFEQWATTEGLPLDKTRAPGRTFVWPQTEQAWFGFAAHAGVQPDPNTQQSVAAR